MPASRKLFHDRTALLLMALAVLLSTGTAIYTLLGISSASSVVVTQYRPSLVNDFSRGESTELYAFVFFSILMMVSSVILAGRVYPVRRSYAITLLTFVCVVLVLHGFVLRALLHLR